jgi:dolichyl-phosphate-mannose--protein O-mannosyl transferase
MEVAASGAQSSSASGRSLPWLKVDTWLLVGITLAAGAVRMIRLGTPTEYLWDEFYAQDACFYLHLPAVVCGTDQELTWTHPPLGKWLIASGIKAFGYTPFGRRAAAMVAGTLAIALLYVLARKILRSRSAATVAALLLAVDWLHFVQSRTAMLDIFVGTLGIAALLFVACDRDRLLAGTSSHAPNGSRFWRLATGVAAGAAIAVKWSGALILLAVIILSVAWEVASRRARGVPRPWRSSWREERLSVAAAFLIVPAVIYVLSYAGPVHTSYAGNVEGRVVTSPLSEGSWFKQLARRQVRMVRFHRTLVGEHYYASPGWSWPLLKRPLAFFAETRGDRYREILATGNPLVWWPALAALGYAAFGLARRRDVSEPHGLIVVAFAVNYLPWIYLSRLRHLGFIYYLVPTIPSMCLALALMARRAQSSTRGKIIIGASVAAAVASFGVFYPVLAGVPLSRDLWNVYMLFRDCQGITEPGVHGGQPPDGWCWI